MISDLKPSEALTVLAERVSRDGAWCRTGAIDSRGCILWHLTRVLCLPMLRPTHIPYARLREVPEIQFLSLATGAPLSQGFSSCCMDCCMVWAFNDSHTQAECVDLCHRAARLAKEAGQ